LRLTAEAQRTRRGRRGRQIPNLKFEISNLKSEMSKLNASRLKPQRPLCELCASAVNVSYYLLKIE
jgi:hypothetical protein